MLTEDEKRIKESHCVQVLGRLASFLKPGRDIKKATLKDIKIELYDFHKYYFGNLLKPEFMAQVHSFVSNPSNCGETVEEIWEALEFAFADEIEILQKSYDEVGSAESWGRSMTQEEHKILIKNKLTSKKAILDFIKQTLKGHGKSTKTAATAGAVGNEDSVEPLFHNKDLFHVIYRLSPTLLQASSSQAKKKPVKAPALSSSESRKAVGKKRKVSEDQDVDDGEAKSSSAATRQKMKMVRDFIANPPIDSLHRVLSRCADGGQALSLEIFEKEGGMLEKIRCAAKQNKDLKPLLHLWKIGFDQVYIFWISLVISSVQQASADKIALDTLYTEEDDTHFILLVGQPQATLLHKMQFHSNHSSHDLLHSIAHDSVKEGENYDDLEVTYAKKPKHSASAVDFQLWKNYLFLASGGEAPRRWSNNYRFVSIKLFKALQVVSKDSCYSLMDQAFDKIRAAVPASRSDLDVRRQKYHSLCEEIETGLTAGDHSSKVKKKAEGSYSWDPYWNLTALLPENDPLMKIYRSGPSNVPPAALKVDGVMIKPVTAKNKTLTDDELDGQTMQRLRYWWLQRPWNHVCEQAKIPISFG